MVDNLSEKFSSLDFNSEKYVRELSQKCVGGQELQQQRKTIQTLFDSTNVLLKKNVYRNYMQFIETAKEITHLESEMYQLSHLLTEQKILLEALANSNSLESSLIIELSNEVDSQKQESEKQKQNLEEDRVRALTSIAEKVEGCAGLLEVKERLLLHEGDVLELDPVENNVIQKTHAYLFSDCLMLTSWITKRRGPIKYKMYALYDLNSMAVVNVKDVSLVERAFKILAYPDTRLFQCSSLEEKKQWLEFLEQAKKTKIANEKVKRDTVCSQNNDESTVKTLNLDSPNSFFDEDPMFHNLKMPEWFIESSEEIDVLIAERHFEDALDVLMKSKNFIQTMDPDEKDPTFLDIKHKVENREKNLIAVLVRELEVSADKSLQGGLRAVRRAVRLLISLNKTIQACDLMLKFGTSIVKRELKSVKREGATFPYIKQLGNLFYLVLSDIIKEFQKNFPDSPACFAALAVWSNLEFTHFMSHVIKQVFVPQSSLTTVSECISFLRNQNSQLCKLGVDLQYQMEGMLLKPITMVLQDGKDKLIEAIKHRFSEENWHPSNLQNKNNLNDFIQEFHGFGITLHCKSKNDCWTDLTSNTISFTKSLMTLFEDCMKLFSPQLYYIIEEVLFGILFTEFKMFQSAIGTRKHETEVELIDINLNFLLDEVLKAVNQNFEKCTLVPSEKLSSLALEFKHLNLKKFKPKPTPRSISKYSSEEFI